MRYFNILGPVNESKHYVVPRSQLVADLVTQIEEGTYFTIYAPRQMGKTTLLRRLAKVLEEKTDYLPITLSFQRFESWALPRFLDKIGTEIGQQIGDQTVEHPRTVKIEALITNQPPKGYEAFWDFFEKLQKIAPDVRVVLVIDEFDATPQEALSPLLQTWREFYLLHEAPRSLHSVVLIGIQNIASLNLGRGSPFDIARQLQLSPFMLAQVQDLMGQYTTESGQAFAEGVIEELYRLTGGHPFLVNRLAGLITKEIATDRTKPITSSNLHTALNKLVRERSYNYETLVRHAAEYEEQVLRILFGARLKFTLNTPWTNALNMHGVIVPDEQGFCQIANPIYERILTDHFEPVESDLQASILVNGYDLRQHVVGNELQMDALLSRFRQFVERRGREAFSVTPMPQEATGQYLLMAYLDLLVRDVGGDLFTEIDSGEGRIDLIVVYRGHRYVVESKIWYGPSKFDKGVKQLEEYLETESATVGYLVVFHARPNVYGKLTHEQLEFVLEREQSKIHVYLVRLGALFDKKKKNKS